jgi:hypothetical protein
MSPPASFLVVAAVLTAFWWLGFERPNRRETPWLTSSGLVVSSAYYVLAFYQAVVWGVLLGWSTPIWLRLTVVLLTIAAVVPRWSRRPTWVPLILPLGLWIAACLLGWWREDGAIRCNDYRRVVGQPGVSIFLSSTEELARCQPDQVLRVERYPRRVWFPPHQDRLIVTSQPGIARLLPEGTWVESRLTGTVCEVALNARRDVNCIVGQGKAQLIMQDPDARRFYVAGWSQPDEGQRGILWEFPLDGPLKPLRELHVPLNTGEGFIDPERDRIVLEVDEGDQGLVYEIRASSMELLGTAKVDFQAATTRYDPSRHEGLACGAAHMPCAIPAFHDWPLKTHPVGPLSLLRPWSLGLVWGCDWDEERRLVYAAFANLGTIEVLDYDSGQPVTRFFVGFGIRDVTLDKNGKRAYLADFLRGDVLEMDTETGAVRNRWFVGRFVRFAVPGPDGKSVFATSSVGIVRIALND